TPTRGAASTSCGRWCSTSRSPSRWPASTPSFSAGSARTSSAYSRTRGRSRAASCARACATSSAPLEPLAEQVQQAAHAVLAQTRRLVAVEERALLGEDQAGAVALGRELRRGERDRDADPAEAHLVRVDDAPVLDDVVEDRLVGVLAAVGQRPAVALPSADAEVELQLL